MAAREFVCDSATTGAGFVPAFDGSGTRVSQAFRARVCEAFGAYYGVGPEVVGRVMDRCVSDSVACGEGLPDALGEFLVQLVELDV